MLSVKKKQRLTFTVGLFGQEVLDNFDLTTDHGWLWTWTTRANQESAKKI